MTFIDDSPPLQTWGAKNTVVDSLEESDRSSGRVVLGTAAGDLYIFIQRGVRLIPREVRGVVAARTLGALAATFGREETTDRRAVSELTRWHHLLPLESIEKSCPDRLLTTPVRDLE